MDAGLRDSLRRSRFAFAQDGGLRVLSGLTASVGYLSCLDLPSLLGSPKIREKSRLEIKEQFPKAGLENPGFEVFFSCFYD